jgi:hypothetical protein
MASDLFDGDQELTPQEAFLYALDDAIGATVQCLSAAGVEQEDIWSAFRQAIVAMTKAAADVDESEFMERHAKAA